MEKVQEKIQPARILWTKIVMGSVTLIKKPENAVTVTVPQTKVLVNATKNKIIQRPAKSLAELIRAREDPDVLLKTI
jgi:hypothetical protein